jgi:hypothetical protein
MTGTVFVLVCQQIPPLARSNRAPELMESSAEIQKKDEIIS